MSKNTPFTFCSGVFSVFIESQNGFLIWIPDKILNQIRPLQEKSEDPPPFQPSYPYLYYSIDCQNIIYYSKITYVTPWLQKINKHDFSILNFSLRAFRPTQGIMIQKFVCACVRPCVRPCVWCHKLVPRQNLRTVIGTDLIFFLIDWYEWVVVQSEKKFQKRCEKKVLNRQKRCEIANLVEFSIENLCKLYIFL